MERARATWTDERLDDLQSHMDANFGRVDQELRALRTEMGDGFRAVNSRIDLLAADLGGRIDEMQRIMVLTLLTAAATLTGVVLG